MYSLLAFSNGFWNAIRNAVSFDGDSNAIESIVGAIAEAAWGIPE